MRGKDRLGRRKEASSCIGQGGKDRGRGRDGKAGHKGRGCGWESRVVYKGGESQGRGGGGLGSHLVTCKDQVTLEGVDVIGVLQRRKERGKEKGLEGKEGCTGAGKEVVSYWSEERYGEEKGKTKGERSTARGEMKNEKRRKEC